MNIIANLYWSHTRFSNKNFDCDLPANQTVIVQSGKPLRPQANRAGIPIHAFDKCDWVAHRYVFQGHVSNPDSKHLV